MADTYTLISSVTVGAGGASSIDFTSIPSTYTDLCVKLSMRGSRSAVYDTVNLTFNGSTGFSSKLLQGNGSTAGSYNYANNIYVDLEGNSATASTFSNAEFYIPNYAGSTYKSVSIDGVGETNGTTAYTNLSAGLWSNTAAITSVKFDVAANTFLQYSTAYLYGIKNS